MLGNLAGVRAALESIVAWVTGGVPGLLATLQPDQIPSGRLYAYDSATKLMQPASGCSMASVSPPFRSVKPESGASPGW